MTHTQLSQEQLLHTTMQQPNTPPTDEDPASQPDSASSDNIVFPPFHVALPQLFDSSTSGSETDDGMDDDLDFDPDLDVSLDDENEDTADEADEDIDLDDEPTSLEHLEPMHIEPTQQQQQQQPQQSLGGGAPRYATRAAMVRGEERNRPLDITGTVVSYSHPSSVAISSRRVPPSLMPDPAIVIGTRQLSYPQVVPFARPIMRAPLSWSASTSVVLPFSLSLPLPLLVGRVRIVHLPDEVLDLILRHLSSRPRATEPLWENFTDAGDAMAFAMTCKRVCALFCARLVSIRTRPERYREDLLYTPPVAGAVIDIRTPTDVSHFATVLRLAGPSLRELLITKSLPCTSWVDTYVSCVTNLRKLALRDVNPEYPLERILEASSHTLRELEIVGATGVALSESQLSAMSRFCCAVHTLALRLSTFDHDWTSVWMGMGPGLTNLSVGATRFWIMDDEEEILLDQIGQYCADIRHLHFYHLGPTLGTACARLCSRYGDQLETLELEQSQLLRPDIALLAARCSSSQVSISHGSSLFSHAYNMDVIELLGSQVKSLRYRSQLAHDESLWEVGRRCKNLRELRLDCAATLTEATLKSILKDTGARLHSLSMSFFVRGLERASPSSALALLGKYARELRELYIGGQMFDLEVFEVVARQCRASLRKVNITLGFRTAEERGVVELETLVGVVRALHVCEKLTSLVIVDRMSNDHRGDAVELRRACYPLRARMSRVSICGVDYVR